GGGPSGDRDRGVGRWEGNLVEWDPEAADGHIQSRQGPGEGGRAPRGGDVARARRAGGGAFRRERRDEPNQDVQPHDPGADPQEDSPEAAPFVGDGGRRRDHRRAPKSSGTTSRTDVRSDGSAGRSP